MEIDLDKLIERTINWGVTKNPDGTTSMQMKLSVEGSLSNVIRSDGKDSCGMKEAVRFFYIAREAWLRGDLETVADYFGILV